MVCVKVGGKATCDKIAKIYRKRGIWAKVRPLGKHSWGVFATRKVRLNFWKS